MDFSISPLPRTAIYGITSLFVAAEGCFFFAIYLFQRVKVQTRKISSIIGAKKRAKEFLFK